MKPNQSDMRTLHISNFFQFPNVGAALLKQIEGSEIVLITSSLLLVKCSGRLTQIGTNV